MVLIHQEYNLEKIKNVKMVQRIVQSHTNNLFVYGTLKNIAKRSNDLNWLIRYVFKYDSIFEIDATLLNAGKYPILSIDSGTGLHTLGEIWRIGNKYEAFLQVIHAEKGAGIYSLYLCQKNGLMFLTFALSSHILKYRFYKQFPPIKDGNW